jgi:hypothetical protein
MRLQGPFCCRARRGSQSHSRLPPPTPPPRSATPYVLRRDIVSCLLVLAQSSRSNQRLMLVHEDDAHEGMAQRLFGKLLRTCGDYPMQVCGPRAGPRLPWRSLPPC